MKKKYLIEIVNILIIFFFCLIPFRNILLKTYIGEPFDTRLIIAIHEHWFWVLKGVRELDDLKIFYPFEKTLGYSDGFLLDGIIHTFFRLIGSSTLNSWNLTNILVLFLGMIGTYLILKPLMKSRFILLILLFLISNNYIFIAYIHLWPQTIGYLLISWPINFIYKIFNNKNPSFYLNLLLIFIPIYALSFWYPAWFLLVSIFLCIMILISNKQSRVRAISWYRTIGLGFNKKSIAILSPIWIYFWYLFVKIYVSNVNRLTRDPEEIYYGPTVKDFFATSRLGGSLFDPIYQFLRLHNAEAPTDKFEDWIIGFSPLVILILLLIIYGSKIDLFDRYLLIATGLILIIFTNFNGYGVFITLWNNFELLQVIRVPSRFNLYAGFLIFIIIFRYIDKVFIKTDKKQLLISFFIILLLLVDNWRVAPGRWSDKDFIDSDLLSLKSKVIKNCEYFSVTNPGAGHWSDTMDATVLSALSNIPTINGYSGTSPGDGIFRNWSDPSNFQEVRNYISRQGLSEKGCLVSNDGLSHVNSLTPDMILSLNTDLIWEQNEKAFWTWQQSQLTELKFNSYTGFTFKIQPELVIEAPPCLTENHAISFSLSGKSVEDKLSPNSYISLSSIPDLNLANIDELKILTNFEGCQVQGDQRTLFFKISIPRL